MFPSHIGSRSTIKRFMRSWRRQRFHPTLVLAQRKKFDQKLCQRLQFPSHIGSRSTPSGKVADMAGLSFPSHIGSRSTKLLKRGTKVIHKFPSHIGSRSTRNLSRLAGRTRYVSIPHWFSLNDLVLCYCIVLLYSFHPTLVLAQLFALKCVCCTYFNVSIPHWFSLNMEVFWYGTQV